MGDTFDIQVAFTNAINPDNFGFTLTWSGGQTAAVPEPASRAIMIGGFGQVARCAAAPWARGAFSEPRPSRSAGEGA